MVLLMLLFVSFCTHFALSSTRENKTVRFSDSVETIVFKTYEDVQLSLLNESVIPELFNRLWVESFLPKIVYDVSDEFQNTSSLVVTATSSSLVSSPRIILELFSGALPSMSGRRSSGGQRSLHGIRAQIFLPNSTYISIHTVVSKAMNFDSVRSDLLFWFSPNEDEDHHMFEEIYFLGSKIGSKILDWNLWVSLDTGYSKKRKVLAREEFSIPSDNSLSIVSIINSNLNRFARTHKCRLIGAFILEMKNDLQVSAHVTTFDNIYDYLVDEVLPVWSPPPASTGHDESSSSTDFGFVVRNWLYENKFFSKNFDCPARVLDIIGGRLMDKENEDEEDVFMGINMGMIPANHRTISRSFINSLLKSIGIDDVSRNSSTTTTTVSYTIDKTQVDGMIRIAGLVVLLETNQVDYFEVFFRKVYMRGISMRELIGEWFSRTSSTKWKQIELNKGLPDRGDFFGVLDSILENTDILTDMMLDCAVFRAVSASIKMESEELESVVTERNLSVSRVDDASVEYFLCL